jgi:hypothetical protein
VVSHVKRRQVEGDLEHKDGEGRWKYKARSNVKEEKNWVERRREI